MRTTLILRQIAGAAAQPKLPFPKAFTPAVVARLQPPTENWLPSLVNAPITLPPQLIPPQEVDPSTVNAVVRKLWRIGKSYLQFYRQGYNQWRSNRDIRKVLRRELMRNIHFVRVPGSSSIAMTRSEFQFLIRTKKDSRKMPCTQIVQRGTNWCSIPNCGPDIWRIHTAYCLLVWKCVPSFNCHSARSIG